MMRRHTLLTTAALLLLLCPHVAEGRTERGKEPLSKPSRGPKTVRVDCTKGESINEALEERADELIIKISGICNEHVVVDRSRVTFRGSGPPSEPGSGPPSEPPSDGIEGPIEGESQGLVEVEGGVVDVEFENLTFRNSETRGIYVRNSGRVKISNCWMLDNGSMGFQAARGYAWILDSRFVGNGTVSPFYGGARVSGAGRLICQRCVFENNGNWGLTAVEGAYVWLDQSTVSDLNAVHAGRGGIVEGTGSAINAEDWAILVDSGGSISWYDSKIAGGLFVQQKAFLGLYGVDVDQLPNRQNGIVVDSTVELVDSQVPGEMIFRTFSNGSARGGATVVGTLDCDSGGDFFCATGVIVGSSTCGLCSLP